MFKHRIFIPVVAFMGCITVFSFVMPYFDFFYSSDLNLINGTLALIIILFPALEALMRTILVTKSYDPGKFFFAVPMREKYYRQGFYYGILILVLLVVPYVRGSASMNLFDLVTSAVCWMLVSVLMLYITQKKTFVNFMNDGIIIKGIDLRLEFPMNDPIRSNSGIYTFRDFRGFYIEGNLLQLFLKDNNGKVTAALPKDEVQHIIAFLLSKEVKRLQIHELSQY